MKVLGAESSHATLSTTRVTETFLDVLAEALGRASAYNRQDQIKPVAVLWPDKDREFSSIVGALKQHLPILTLGDYSPSERRGPTYWIRCVVAGVVDAQLHSEKVPVIYLPGVGRGELRPIEQDAPELRRLRPIAELQFRGEVWCQKNQRDWTVAAFLQNREGGIGVQVGADRATREALVRALPVLAEQTVNDIRSAAPLKADFLHALLTPDEVRSMLAWLNDPAGYRDQLETEAWEAFTAVCRERFAFDPLRDGPITGAQRLGGGEGPWARVWSRFVEAPTRYPGIPDALERAHPGQLSLMGPSEAWPQHNEVAESTLRTQLSRLANVAPEVARAKIVALEAEHGHRRASVWNALGRSPLAAALEHVSALARSTVEPLRGATIQEMAVAYSTSGWRTDAAFVDCLASVDKARDQDVAAVTGVALSLYRSWVETAATRFQAAVRQGNPASTYVANRFETPIPGTVVLFTDGLRFDYAARLDQLLRSQGLASELAWRLTALPSITGTAKPATSPVADRLGGAGGLEPREKGSGRLVKIGVLRDILEDARYQVLQGNNLGDPTGCAWTESGTIDSFGHPHGWRVCQHALNEVEGLGRRIEALLDHGWQRVVVVTDHGWLLLPGGLPKAELAEHLTVTRKGRCARLRPTAETEYQIVPWHWDPAVRVAVAPGIHCFRANSEYEHGGLSPQECVVPILTISNSQVKPSAVEVDPPSWRRLRCTTVVRGAPSGAQVDLRLQAADTASSIAGGGKPIGDNGMISLLVVNEELEGKQAMLVVIGKNGVLLYQHATTVGGERAQ